MKQIERIIHDALKDYDEGRLDEHTKHELVEKLSVYHEELTFQNDELRATNEKLEETKADFERLFMDSPVGNILVDETGTVLKYNHYASELFDFGLEREKPLNRLIATEDQDKLYLFLRDTVQSKNGGTVEVSTANTTENKRIRLISQWTDPADNGDRAVMHIAVIDETKAYRYRSQVEYLSYHDQLTGLFNRRYFDQALQEITQGNNHPVSLVVADVNGLKLVNDTYGHVTGDALIAEVANRLRSVVRDEDVLARHGGDEFAIIMPGVGEEGVKETILKLDAYCEDVIMKDIKLSVAFGYATNHSPDQSIQAVFQLAEDRMYTNKLYKKTSRRNDLINGMMATLYEKNPREKEHSERVSLLSVNLAKAAGLDESAVQRIRTAALLHDIGKIAIDYSVLQSEEPLNELEKEEIRKHTEIGYRILNASSEFSEIAEIVLCHHERMDGSGYPRQLSGSEIPTESKIIAITNAYDAMITEQTYRASLPVKEAVNELQEGAGTQFDPVLTGVFIERVIPDEGDRL